MKKKYIIAETGNLKQFLITLNQRDDMFGDDDKWPVYFYSIIDKETEEVLVEHSDYFNFEYDAKDNINSFFKSNFKKYGHIIYKESLPNIFQ